MANNFPSPQWFTGSEYTHRVARAIAKYGPIARTTLAQMLGVSQGALSRITSDLIYANVIEELPANITASGRLPQGFIPKENPDRRGRPQTSLCLRTDQYTFIGANIHGTDVSVQQVDALCQPVGDCITRPLESLKPQDVTEQITAMARECQVSDYPAPASIGLSLGGHVADDRYVTYAPFLHWNGHIDLGGMAYQSLGLPVAVFNDLDSVLLHEGWFGVAAGIKRYAVVTIGVGVGYSLAENGHAVDYPDKSYGLVGHVLVDPEGPRCSSGHIGCSQCLTSASIATEYSDIIGHAASFEEFTNDVLQGKPHANRLAERTCFRLGVLVATIANMAMPSKVLISGEGSFLAQMNIEVIRSGIMHYRHSQTSTVDFEVLSFDWSDWTQAAAARAIARYIG